MADQNAQIHRAGRRSTVDPWSAGAAVIALLVLLPIASVIWIALNPTENIWPHLIATTLPRYLTNSLVLAGSVGAIAAVVGTGCAWMIVMYRFPGARLAGMAVVAAAGDPGLCRRLCAGRFPGICRPGADRAARAFRMVRRARLLVSRDPVALGCDRWCCRRRLCPMSTCWPGPGSANSPRAVLTSPGRWAPVRSGGSGPSACRWRARPSPPAPPS